MTNWPTRMRKDWDARAKEDAKFYIKADGREFNDWTNAEWLDSGKADLDGMYRPFVIAMMDQGHPVSGNALYEVGCGAGRMTYWLAQSWDRVYALDISAAMIAQARETLLPVKDKVTLIVGSGRTLRTSESLKGIMDMAISWTAFGHIPEPQLQMQYLTDIGWLLRPGGHFLIHLYGDQGEYERLRKRWQVRAETGDLDGWDEKARAELHRYETWMRTPLSREQVDAALAAGGLELLYEVGAGTQNWMVGGWKPA